MIRVNMESNNNGHTLFPHGSYESQVPMFLISVLSFLFLEQRFRTKCEASTWPDSFSSLSPGVKNGSREGFWG